MRTRPEEIKKSLQRKFEFIENDLLEMMKYVGESFVRDARDNLKIDAGLFPQGEYTDRTANLRSSIGYCITKNGTVIFHNVQGSPEGLAGFWKAFTQFFSRSHKYHLWLLAGMEYASYVESKGFNVISSQANVALVDLHDMFIKYKNTMQFDK